ncbi:restriction endonuclease subunit S [Vibrio alginolyticus]|uniref:restriction endonuclease subunit S n=1 Tax=Vibrio alginolyticus TaxID=663 RepID=UPI0021601E2A|nr:restriction endonuclease subunit S [Vibrio alginolyticus]MCS0279270.1 restriction endonuclease subunit S [Vibrio alginolyticus]
MSFVMTPLKDLLLKVEKWNPAKEAGDMLIKYIDLSSVDKDSKQLIADEVQELFGSNAPSRARQLVSENDILVATVRPNLNGVASVPCEFEGATASTGYCVLRVNEKLLDSKYLFYWVQTELFVNDMISKASGANYPAVSDKIIKDSKIPLPPLDEQKRIAAILDKADAIRQKRKQAIDLADEFLRSVFLDMFGDPVTNPKGLSEAKLTEFADVITGFAFKSAEYVEDDKVNVRLCRGANTLPGYFDWKDTAYWDSSKLSGIENYKINAGDVILAMDRPWISSGLKVCVFPDNERDTYLVQRVARMRPKNSLYTDYLYSSILSKAFERHCCPTETTVPHISPVELKNFSLLMPDEELLKKYNNAVTTVRKSKSAMEAAWLESNHIFESLSQKAFSGQL